MASKNLRIDKQHRYPWPVIELAVKFYCQDELTYRAVAEKLSSAGVEVSHKTVYEWVQKFSDKVKTKASKKAPTNFNVDESEAKCNGEWCYLYRAYDKQNSTVGIHLRKNKSLSSAKNFFKKSFSELN